MQLKAQKWGNSLAIRLPRAIVQDAQIKENELLEARIAKGKLVIERRRFPTLKEMMAQVPANYRETEIDTGPALGKEHW